MRPDDKNIVLIGMPGAGKSTIGVMLAKEIFADFMDTDILIQTNTGRPLQDIVDNDGHMVLREIEAKTLSSINCGGHVIATGGSAVYSEEAMNHLKKNGVIVYLDVTVEVLEKRIHNFKTRGLAKAPDQTFDELFEERSTLYRKYADITVESSAMDQEEVCSEIISAITEKNIFQQG